MTELSSLSKQLVLLFFLIASIIILTISMTINITWLTSLKRVLIGGIGFSLIGLIIGQVISYNLNSSQGEQKNKPNDEQINITDKINKNNNDNKKINSIEFDKVDIDQENIVNLINEDEDGARMAADIVKSLNEDS